MISDKLVDLDRLQTFKEECDATYAKQAGIFQNMIAGGIQVQYEELPDGTYNLVIKTIEEQ